MPGPADRSFITRRLTLVAILSLAFSFVLHGLSGQDYGSHGDETTKVRQVLQGERNFYHPPLMIETVSAFARVLRTTDPFGVMRLGRTVSNLLAGASLLLLAAAAALSSRNPLAALLVFAACATSTSLWVAGRYLKEDIYFLFGVAVCCCAFAALLRWPRARMAAALFGVAAALLVSSKYAGALFLFGGCVASLATPAVRATLRQRWPVTLAGFFATGLVVNHAMLTSRDTFRSGLRKEVVHVAVGHREGVFFWPADSPVYARALLDSYSTIGMVSLAGLLLLGWHQRVLLGHKARSLLLFMAGGTVIYGIAAQFAPLKIDARYVFPVFLALTFCAGLTAAELSGKDARRTVRILALSLLAGVVLGQSLACIEVVRAARYRPVDALAAWIRANVSPGETILAEQYAGLTFRNIRTGMPNLSGISVTTVHNIGEECRSRDCTGFDYVVLSCNSYQRYFQDGVTLAPEGVSARQVYEELMRRHQPVFSMPSAMDPTPQLRLGVQEGGCVAIYRNPFRT